MCLCTKVIKYFKMNAIVRFETLVSIESRRHALFTALLGPQVWKAEEI